MKNRMAFVGVLMLLFMVSNCSHEPGFEISSNEEDSVVIVTESLFYI